MPGQKLLTTTLILGILMVAWDEMKRLNHYPPVPSRFIQLAAVWGTLGIITAFGAGEFAAALSVGLLMAMVFNYYNGTAVKHTPTVERIPAGSRTGAQPNA